MLKRLSVLFLFCSACVSVGAQTLPLAPGAGFEWEQVGDIPSSLYYDLTFDAGGTLWDSRDVRWLDPVTGTWVEPTLQNGRAILTLGPHPEGGPARADTVFYAIGLTRRSVDGGETWGLASDLGNAALQEIPAGYPYGGRLLVGGDAGYSDDRGDSWTESEFTEGPELFLLNDFLVLPPPGALPGTASGLDPAAPPAWPSGRVVALGKRGVALSDDGGALYRPSAWYQPANGRDGQRAVVVRRPDEHPLGPGPRLVMAAAVSGSGAVSAWTSDDAGETWTERAALYEPFTSAGYGRTPGLFALSPPGVDDPGASGEAIAMIGLGHIYRTTDAGETWAVVGRAPEMSAPGETSRFAGAAELGPDGRLYVGVSANGSAQAWVWRTAERFAVASEDAAVPEREVFGVAVRPNPSAGGAVTVELTGEGTARAWVVDAVGRTMAELYSGELRGARSLALDTSAWAAGVYTVVVETDGERRAEAFTVLR